MKVSLRSSSLTLALMLGTLSVVGCGGAMSFPDSVASIQAAGPPLSGTVFGGHAPIVGAHVYLLQPGISGIGSLATSILGNNGATSANGYTITSDVNDPNVVAGSKYVTTDSSGGFSLTGAYTCTATQPVYIYAWGGTPSTTALTPAPQAVYTVTQLVVSNAGTTSQTFTFTVTPSELLYTGENVTLAGFTGLFAGLNGAQVVLPDGLSPTTFEITSADGGKNLKDQTYSNNAQYKLGTVTAAPQGNSAIVELATLGNCPSSGNFSTPGNGAISYVYLNEVSTVATAYTFQPFTSQVNNSAWAIGSNGGTQGLLGIENAAANAAQLYNIQGGGQISTIYDGEGHIANSLTVGGNGIVPQATIDTLANILAACVDSAPNGSNTGTNGLSAQCSTLFTTATDDGSLLGVQPTDTATAAINIARYPAGNSSSINGVNTKFASDLFAIPTGDVPFTPNLSNAPNDFTIVINYPNTAVGGYTATNTSLVQPESIAVDALGQVFITARGGASTSSSVVRWSPLGVPNFGPFSIANTIFGYVSIDGSNNAWASQVIGAGSIEEFIYNPTTHAITTAAYGSGYINPRPLITNQSGDALFIASNSPNGGNYQLFEYGPLGSAISGSPFSLSSTILTANDPANHGAIAANGDLWFTSEVSDQIGLVTPSGTAVFSPSITTGVKPEFPAIDHLGNAWVPVQATASQIYAVSPTGISSSYDSSTTKANLVDTFGAAIDGNGNLWLTNRCGFNGGCTNVTGTNTIVELSGLTHTAISPPTNYYPETQYPASSTTFTRILNDPVNLAIDPSGNIWTTNYIGSEVTEMIGAAAPVVTPLSTAAGTNTLGIAP